MQQKSVAFVINSLEGGGAEGVMCRLLAIMESYFREQRTTVYLILLDDTEQAHVCPGYVNKVVLNSQGSLAKGYTLLQSCLKKIQPRVCVSFLARSNFLNVALSKRLSYRAVISERVNTSRHFAGGFKNLLSKVLVRATYPKADRVIAVSEGVKADLIQSFGVPSRHIDVVYNPYDMEKIQKMADEPVRDLPVRPYIVATGRLVKIKNYPLLLAAFAASDLEDALVILGQGDQEAKLREQSRALGIAHRVHFLGFKANPYPYIKNARFFVSTSNAEGFPNAIVEAMCLGKAIVATNCESGPAEILSGSYPLKVQGFLPSQYGCLCSVGDKLSVVKAMNYINNDEHCAHYADKSQERARDFGNAIFHNKITRIFESLTQTETRSYVSAS